MPDPNAGSDKPARQFAFLRRRNLSTRAMRTGMRIYGPRAPSLQMAVIAGLLGFAPLGASSAASADAGEGRLEPATSAALIELAPGEATADVAAPAPASAPEATATSIGGGSASYYADRFHGRRTASGETFDNGAMTAAHRTLPFGSLVRVTNPVSGKSVTVRINDRGPFTGGRVIDVSRAAAEELGLVRRGHAKVDLALIEG